MHGLRIEGHLHIMRAGRNPYGTQHVVDTSYLRFFAVDGGTPSPREPHFGAYHDAAASTRHLVFQSVGRMTRQDNGVADCRGHGLTKCGGEATIGYGDMSRIEALEPDNLGTRTVHITDTVHEPCRTTGPRIGFETSVEDDIFGVEHIQYGRLEDCVRVYEVIVAIKLGGMITAHHIMVVAAAVAAKIVEIGHTIVPLVPEYDIVYRVGGQWVGIETLHKRHWRC